MGRNKKKWGTCDFSQIENFRDNLERLGESGMQEFCESAARELAARLLALVIPATPVGQYPKNTGKKGGTLRRGWTADQQADDGGAAFAQSLEITKTNDTYTVVIENAVEYAAYVEFGHRTANHRGWVNGKYFLTRSEQQLQDIAPQLLEQKLAQELKEALGGG